MQDRRLPGLRTYYSTQRRREWRPPTDVYETDDAIVVKVEIPGMNESDFGITMVDRRLVVSGSRPEPEHKVSYHNMEIQYGPFRTEVHVAVNLQEDAIEASYEGGFLYVRLPLARVRRIPVS
ncbi:MAG: Hsp20/alpha crystallin family protein [Anaerolineae bacterium]|jgi:HSP20 family protein|nr:Hsp20/alpha crystallin family protein [Chloroflexota bacterium]